MSEGGGKHEGPEPKTMMVLVPGAAWEPVSSTDKTAWAGSTFQICALALAKSNLTSYSLCDVPSHESFNGKEKEPATPMGTGESGEVRVGEIDRSWRETSGPAGSPSQFPSRDSESWHLQREKVSAGSAGLQSSLREAGPGQKREHGMCPAQNWNSSDSGARVANPSPRWDPLLLASAHSL